MAPRLRRLTGVGRVFIGGGMVRAADDYVGGGLARIGSGSEGVLEFIRVIGILHFANS